MTEEHLDRLGDQADRDRITSETSTTLFVNAGAGSGKTKSLVDRITTLVLTDGVAMRHVAAVTFTEKAGAELRDRLREEFEKRWRDSARDSQAQQWAADALDDLDGAAIGTLHAFAQRLLTEHPIEAGLPPAVELLDEVGSSVAFEQRWAQLYRELLDDESVAEPLLVALALGMKSHHLRSLVHLLGSDWDLIESAVLGVDQPPLDVPDLAALRLRLDDVVSWSEACSDDGDLLLAKLAELRSLGRALDQAHDLETRMAALQQIAKVKTTKGRKGNWTVDIATVRAAGAEVADEAQRLVGVVLDQCLRHLTRWAARKVLEAAQERRRSGTLEFHDLLVLARDVLRREAGVRAALHDRYQRLLLDEFQDTDLIQIELAVRIAGGSEAAQPDWRDVAVPDGRLFVVGDAKQSIYRFRRASIATYLQAQEHLGERAHLTTNFRTVAPVLDWVNAVFGSLIEERPDAQPAYEPLEPFRSTVGRGPAVTVLGAEAHTDLPRAAASVLRTREAVDVAGVIREALGESWEVYDRRQERWRPAEHRDIAVLVPARTSLPYLEEALDAAGVPYRAEASSLVYQAQEVRDLLACARALADTSDQMSLVAALRSPLFGCGDDDLWRWKHAGGRFSIYGDPPTPELADSPVGLAVEYLRRLSFEVRWSTPSEILGRIVSDRRMLEVAATGPRARDAWRRLRFVVDQARAWSEASQGGLRAYLAWAAHQGEEASRVAESILPETDVDAVRVMTVHAAKGLEFPIVVLSGMTAQHRGSGGVRLLWDGGGDGYEVGLTKALQTGDFSTQVPIDEQMDALEKRRLLYVAATRARDHLVVSVHRDAHSNKVTAATLIAEAGGASAGSPYAFAAPAVTAPTAPPEPYAIAAQSDFDHWRADVSTARARAAELSAVTASGLEGSEPEVVLAASATSAGLAKGARDLALAPWTKGRYGSAIGRAVHAVLQVVDLTTGEGLEAAVAAQAVAEGVVSEESLVGDLVRSALASDLVRRAAQREHWRETYVGTEQEDGSVLEGFVDLVFRDDDGALVIVDYKTDAVPVGALDSRVAYYRPQMQAYRRCLSAATGADVRTQLLFLHPQESTAVPVV